MDNGLLQSARNGTRRVGKKELIWHLEGKRLTQREAIRAKCYDCSGMGSTGTCSAEDCSLSPYSPYTRDISCRPHFYGATTENKGIVDADGRNQ